MGLDRRVWIAPGSPSTDRFETIKLPIPAKAPAPVQGMLSMYALSVFVAVVAYHRNIRFVTHPMVTLYKCRAKDLVSALEIKHAISSPPESMSDRTILYLAQNLQIHLVDAVCCWVISTTYKEGVKNWCRASDQKFPTSILRLPRAPTGHSMYQRAVQDDTSYMILEPRKNPTKVEGTLEHTYMECLIRLYYA